MENATCICQTTKIAQGNYVSIYKLRYFMNDIMTGKKKFVKNDAIKKAYCPQIEGLYMGDLVNFIVQRPFLHEYFPAIEEIPKQGK